MIVGGMGGKGADGPAAQIAGAKGGNASNQTAGVNQSCGDANGGAGANKMIAHWTEGACPQLRVFLQRRLRWRVPGRREARPIGPRTAVAGTGSKRLGVPQHPI